MKKLLCLLALIVLMMGCNRLDTNITKSNSNDSKFYIVENNIKTYFKDYEFMKDLHDFDSVLKNTIVSFNEIKDGKRDFLFINQIESEELKKNREHQIFKEIIPGEGWLKTVRADINEYKVTALYYDKDQNLIKVYIKIERYEKYNGGDVKVLDNQTYIYKIENSKLLLKEYHLSQHLK